jgi:hypothetical protein
LVHSAEIISRPRATTTGTAGEDRHFVGLPDVYYGQITVVITDPARPAAAARHLALFGTSAVAFCAASLGLLHVLPPGRGLSPVSTPLSDYALTSAAWLFDMSVLILAIGVGAVLAALVMGGYVRTGSLPFVVMSACCLALIAVVIFPDHALNGLLGPSGWVHWGAAMVAFGSLPFASALLRRRHRGAGCRVRLRGLTRALSTTAGACFVVLFAGSTAELTMSLRVWRVGGIVERILGLTEMAVTVLMAGWARSGCACTAPRSSTV